MLICDDVYTTGTSMREVYEDGAIGIVVFARNKISDDWIKAIGRFRFNFLFLTLRIYLSSLINSEIRNFLL